MQVELATTPSHMIRITFELCHVLDRGMDEDEDERRRHGIGALWSDMEKMAGDASADEWEYAYETLYNVMRDRNLLGRPFQ